MSQTSEDLPINNTGIKIRIIIGFYIDLKDENSQSFHAGFQGLCKRLL